MSDLDIVTDLYAAMAARDFARALDLIVDECVITQDERLPWGGRYVGRDGFADMGARLTGTITSTVTTDALFEADGNVIQFGRSRGTINANGAAFDIPEVHTWTVRNGKAVAAHFSIDTPAMLQALG